MPCRTGVDPLQSIDLRKADRRRRGSGLSFSSRISARKCDDKRAEKPVATENPRLLSHPAGSPNTLARTVEMRLASALHTRGNLANLRQSVGQDIDSGFGICARIIAAPAVAV